MGQHVHSRSPAPNAAFLSALYLDEELHFIAVEGYRHPQASAYDVHGHHGLMRGVGLVPGKREVLLERFMPTI